MNIVKNITDTVWQVAGYEKKLCQVCYKEFWPDKNDDKNCCSKKCQLNMFMEVPFGPFMRERLKDKKNDPKSTQTNYPTATVNGSYPSTYEDYYMY